MKESNKKAKIVLSGLIIFGSGVAAALVAVLAQYALFGVIRNSVTFPVVFVVIVGVSIRVLRAG